MAALLPSLSVAQTTNEGMIFLTRKQIVDGAMKEGKLYVTPGLDDSTIALLLKAFQKKYPFIQADGRVVDGIPAAEKQVLEMSTGKANVDAVRLHSTHYSQYFGHNLLARYDFKGMVKAGHLKIPLEMIDDSAGVIVWLGSQFGLISYNSKLVSAEKAPKGWESCLDPAWKGKFSVDTKPNIFTWLRPVWGEEKIVDFSRKLKDNDPVWSRGNTRNMTLLASGEVLMNCGMLLHSVHELLRKDPTAPVKTVIPDPFPMSQQEPEAVYTAAKHPHAALLWIEFLASREGQELAEAEQPGRSSYLVEGTLTNKLVKGGTRLSLCLPDCRIWEDKMMERIAVEAWKLPKVGYSPK